MKPACPTMFSIACIHRSRFIDIYEKHKILMSFRYFRSLNEPYRVDSVFVDRNSYLYDYSPEHFCFGKLFFKRFTIKTEF